MVRTTALGMVFAALPICSLDAASADPVSKRGLEQTTGGRPIAEAAIDDANQLLDGTLYLAPSWEPRALSDVIPVYLVTAPAGAASTPAAVPRGCRCIFVNPTLLDAWLRHHSTGTGRMNIDTSHFLAFMLLHEAGHIIYGTSAVAFEAGELSQFNQEPSLAKAREEAADEFAADLVRRHVNSGVVSDSTITANWIAIALLHLSWNMQAYRSIHEFGASSTGKPSVYFDPGYSHPNLAWRVLRSNYLIAQSPDAKALLDAFEAARALGANAQPLYQKAPSTVAEPP